MGEGPARLPPQRSAPCRPEKPAFGPGSRAGAPGTDAQRSKPRLQAKAPAEVFEQVPHPRIPVRHPDSGSLAKGVAWPRSMEDD